MAADEIEVTRERVLRFRVRAHGLAARRGKRSLVAAARVIGMRWTAQTPLAFAARIDGVTAADAEAALAGGRLVGVYGPRGTKFLVPSDDAGVFTLGSLPSGEDALRFALKPIQAGLDAAGLSATDALEIATEAVASVLSRGPMLRAHLAKAVTSLVPEALRPPCRGRCPDPHIEELLFRLVGCRGAMWFTGFDDVVSRPTASHVVAIDAPAARTELVRRYLSSCGPAPVTALAEWLGTTKPDASASIAQLGDDVVEVASGSFLLARDRARLERGQHDPVEGVRFLPAYDPMILDRDRATLVPDRQAQQQVWRAAANPGVVLVDGELVATWRTQSDRSRIVVAVQALTPAFARDDQRLLDEGGAYSAVMGDDRPTEIAFS